MRSTPSSGRRVLSEVLPLAGVRVLAFTHVAAGPYATLQLAMLGADVIKVESATRVDPWRYRDRNRDPERSRPFADHNKNTRSVSLNLKTEGGRSLAVRLAERCDVVIDNFSAGVMQRLGLGYEVLKAANPAVLVIHLSPLGSAGPSRHFVTFGPSMMAMSGMTHLWNHPDASEPVGSQSSYPDYLVGVYAAFAVIAMLHERARAGQGRELDLTQIEVALGALGPAVVAEANGIATFVPEGNESEGKAPHGCYPCRGGNDDWCVISVRDQDEWSGLVQALGRPDLEADERYRTPAGRWANRVALDEVVTSWTLERTAREVMERLQARGVPAGMVATGRDLATDPHLVERGFLLDMDHPRLGECRYPGPPFRIGSAAVPIWRLGPLMGEDTRAVLSEVLGLTQDQIAGLESSGVLT
jgi:crotonobetainyl-CoA:carnitine CoA-transferase CaiB-like acyl-CoA transferase